MSNEKSKFPASKAVTIVETVAYADGSVVSRTIIDNKSGTVTLFAFDAEEGLSEHTAPFDALVQVLDGKAEITIGAEVHHLSAGQMILMPANVPHALRANERFKMLLVMVRG